MSRTQLVPISPTGKQRRQQSCRGMSMVEVLVAILLFSIGGLAVLTMTTSSFHTNSNSTSVDEAVNLARLHMDRLLGLDYTDAQLLDTNADGAPGLLNNDAASADYNLVSGRYRILWNVAGNTPVNGAKSVAVIVTWPNATQRSQVVFQTIKAE